MDNEHLPQPDDQDLRQEIEARPSHAEQEKKLQALKELHERMNALLLADKEGSTSVFGLQQDTIQAKLHVLFCVIEDPQGEQADDVEAHYKLCIREAMDAICTRPTLPTDDSQSVILLIQCLQAIAHKLSEQSTSELDETLDAVWQAKRELEIRLELLVHAEAVRRRFS